MNVEIESKAQIALAILSYTDGSEDVDSQEYQLRQQACKFLRENILRDKEAESG